MSIRQAETTKNITLDSVNVNTMYQNAVLAVGKGDITGMDANEKVNQAQGSFYGNKNHLQGNVNQNNDHDMADGIIEDGDIKIANVNSD